MFYNVPLVLVKPIFRIKFMASIFGNSANNTVIINTSKGFVSEFIAFNWYIFVVLTNKKLLLPS